MRKYRSTDGMTATIEEREGGSGFYMDSHVIVECGGVAVVCGDFNEGVSWLAERFGGAWMRERR